MALPTCFGKLSSDTANVCSGRGTCTGPDICRCDEPSLFGGSECEIALCGGLLPTDPNVCSGRGKFNIAFGGFSCEKSGFSCFGTHAENSQSCSGNGICIDADVCQCDKNHVGFDCSIPKCFNISATDSNVCTSKGKCTNVDTCQCNSGYVGNSCEYYQLSSSETTNVTILVKRLNFTCFGIEKTSALVCSGKGSCEHSNVWTCLDGYFGENCEQTSCFGIPANNSQTCNSRGICKDYNQCECLIISNNTLLNGSDCSQLYCQGSDNQFHLSSTPESCSGNGKCTMNGCKCHG
ncbi:predicted protein [Naegleria gruberi]|uniref:Predicted protein n=1 Tax=Naegleria gruberi TaxID=5762 RepID=D2VBQ3_NAEGR|nr:uncharacterized protein NAEGRDRAFT_66295 [Naegleria gruberi]EFC45836.1 predicted protein [Naegleria gruberi]|eukprot:XP_002678580.1 predicted protein [Naegleria gruberi strain NEG-M]